MLLPTFRLGLAVLTLTGLAGQALADPIQLRGAYGLDAPPEPRPAAAVVTGHAVQIGVFNSEKIAKERWTAIRRGFGQDFETQRLRVIPIELNGRAAYRTQIAGFESRSAASNFCGALSRSGHACFVPPLVR